MSGTVAAAAADFDYRANLGETGMLGRLANPARQFVVVDVSGLPAGIADQENTVVEAAGMLVGDIGIGAFHATGKVGADEQIEDPIDAVCRDPLAARLGNGLGNVIGAGRPVESGKGIEHRCAHIGPLLAALGHSPRRGIAQRRALMKLVGMSGHKGKIGLPTLTRKRGGWCARHATGMAAPTYSAAI